MYLRILIVEDNELFLNSNTRQIRSLLGKYQVEAEVKTFSSTGELLTQYIKKKQIDLAILDIEIGSNSGIALGKKIKRYNPFVALIYITSHLKYIEKANGLNPDGFLVKPVEYHKLDSLFCKVVMMKEGQLALEEKNARLITIKENWNTIEISEKDILYIRTLERKLQIKTTDRTYMTNETITNMEQKASDLLVRIGRDLIVNRTKIKKVEKGQIEMVNHDILDIPKCNYNSIMKKLHS